jgi:hypothetical protein
LIRASGVFFPENLAKSGWRLHRAITSPSRYPDANAWGLATEERRVRERSGVGGIIARRRESPVLFSDDGAGQGRGRTCSKLPTGWVIPTSSRSQRRKRSDMVAGTS